MRILIIEDDKKSSEHLQKELSETGFAVDVAGNGEDGLHRASQVCYDLIILDVMLPAMDGWEVISEIRRTGNETPVLIVTARDSPKDRMKGLELRADDYIVKPLAFPELFARICSILRRRSVAPAETIRIADLEIDLTRQRASRSGTTLDLALEEFQLLLLLARHAGEVLPRPAIAEQIWNMDFHKDRGVVDTAVNRLRRKVDAPFGTPLIHTVWGVGVVLEKR